MASMAGLPDEARPSPPTKTGLSPMESTPPPPPPAMMSAVNKTLHSSHISGVQHRSSPAPTPPSVPSPAAAVGGGVPLPSPSPKGTDCCFSAHLIINIEMVITGRIFGNHRTIGA